MRYSDVKISVFKPGQPYQDTVWWNNFYTKHSNLQTSFMVWTAVANSLLKKYNGKYNYMWNEVEFETEEDMTRFIMEWS